MTIKKKIRGRILATQGIRDALFANGCHFVRHEPTPYGIVTKARK